jgi:hypothetical protein
MRFNCVFNEMKRKFEKKEFCTPEVWVRVWLKRRINTTERAQMVLLDKLYGE